MTLGERLRELRLHNGLTLMQLSALCHVSYKYLSDLERDVRVPSFHVVTAIAQVYEMTVGDLLLDVEEWGDVTEKALAPGLLELCDDATIGGELTPAWLSLLGKISLEGKRPQTKREWLEIYLHLKRILEKESA
jgi:XRE family transcriptional regulator, regulator of sulfur utilization